MCSKVIEISTSSSSVLRRSRLERLECVKRVICVMVRVEGAVVVVE